MKKRLLRYGSMISAICACVVIPVGSASADGVFFADGISVVSPFEQGVPMVDGVYASAPVSAVSVSSLDQVKVIPSAYEEVITPVSYLEQESSKNRNVREISSLADGVLEDLVAVGDGTSVGGYLPNMSRSAVVLEGEYQVASAAGRHMPEMLIDVDASSVQIVGDEDAKINDENLTALMVSASAPPVIKLDEEAGRVAAKTHARHENVAAYEYEKDMYVVKLPDSDADLSGSEFVQVKPEDVWAPSKIVPARKPVEKIAEAVEEKAVNIPDEADIGTVPVATNDVLLSAPKVGVVPMELRLNFKRGQTIISQKTLELLRNMAAEVNQTSIVAVEISASVGTLPQKKRAKLISGIFKEEGVDGKKIHINYDNSEFDNSVVVKMLGKSTRRKEVKVSKWANRISEASYLDSSYYVLEK